MLLTSKSAFEDDMKFMKNQMKRFCNYTRFNILLFIYDNDYDILNQLEKQARDEFSDELKT